MPYFLDVFMDELTIVSNSMNVQDWEPLSLQQRQAASVVEVFRIIEEVCIKDKRFSVYQYFFFIVLFEIRPMMGVI